MRRYLMLFVLTLVGVALAHALARRRPAGGELRSAASAPERLVRVELRDDSVVTRPSVIRVGDRVALAIENRTARAARVSLSGYEDRLRVADLAPDSIWHGALVADRPGEQLAWLVNGVPRGRLDVSGSHLVEGHR